MNMIFSHLEFVCIKNTDINIKKNRTRRRERDILKEKFTKKNIDRYPGTRQLVLELSASAHNDYIQ